MDRTEEIRERYKGPVHAYWQSDTKYLLERVSQLERENARLKKMLNLYTNEELEAMRRADEMTPELRARLKAFMENED